MCTSRQTKACQNMPHHAKTCQNMPQHANATKHAEKPNKRSKPAQWFHSRFGWKDPGTKTLGHHKRSPQGSHTYTPPHGREGFGPHPSCRDFFKTLRAAVNSTDPSQRDKTRSLSLRLYCVRGRLSISDTGTSPVQTKVGLTQSTRSSRHRQSNSAPLGTRSS